MTNQSFDNEVKQKMSAHEMPVPPGVWESIAQKKRKRRFFVFWWITGVGVLLLGIIGGRAIINNNNKKGTSAVAVNVEQNQTVDSNDTRTMNDRESNDNNDKTDSPNVVSTTMIPDMNEKREEQNNRGMPTGNTRISNQSNSSIGRESSSSIQIIPGTIGEKKKQQRSGNNNNNTGEEVIVPVISFNQPGRNESNDPAPSGSYSPIMNKRIIDKAGLINTSAENKMTIVDFIRPPASFDSALTNDIRESASALLKPKRSSWMIDVAVNTFMPVRRQQSLTAITRTTINPMHRAEFRADKIRTVLHPALSYSVTLRKKINNRIGIGAGVQYAVIKEIVTLSGKETNTQYSIVQRLQNGGSGPQLVNDTVANITTGTRIIDAVNSYRYFNMPLSAQYMLINQRDWSLQLNGGIDIGLYSSYNNSISGPLIAENAGGPIASKQNSSIKTGFFTGLRYSHYLNKGMQWFAEPYLRFNAGQYGNTVINNKAVHQAGIGVGLSFNFGGR